MGSVVGFAAFTLLSYVLIIINLSVLMLPTILATLFFLRKNIVKEIKTIRLKLERKTFIVLAVFAIGIAGQLAVISPSGRLVNGDLVFWSSHGHDGMWHLALMEEIKKGWPFENPVFAGEKLANYHFFSDIAPAVISKHWPGSNLNLNLDLYFRVFPFIYSLFLGVTAYYLTKRMTKSFGASVWAVVFTYFAGSFGYLIDKGESVFWATQIQSASGNPPQIISDFLVLAFLYYAYSYIRKRDKKTLLVSVVLLGTLTEFKVYGAVVLLGATLLAGLWQIAIPAGILAAALYLPNSSGGTSFLIFQPWWYVRTMIVEPSRLNLVDWELRRQTYMAEHNWKRVIFLETVGFLIFFFGNLGVRFVGIWDFIKSGRTIFKSRFNLLFVLTILISLALPLLFLQKGVASNTSQFLQYFILLFGILAGISVSRFMKLIKYPALQILASILLLAFMLPTQIGLLKDFYGTPQNPRGAFAKISAQELAALDFLNKNTPPDSTILTAPKNEQLKETGPTPNIWAWANTGYVAAISGRREYFSDREQVDIMGYNFSQRDKIKETIFNEADPLSVGLIIKSTNADYIYFPKILAPKIDLTKAGLTKFFDNPAVEIWKI